MSGTLWRCRPSKRGMLPDPAPSHSIRNWDVVFSTPEPLMCRFAGGGIADYTFYFEQNSQPVPINLNLLAYRTWTETVSATLTSETPVGTPEPDTWISTGGMLACFGLKIR